MSAALAILLVATFTWHLLKTEIPPRFADKDFANYWTAGRLILNGQVSDLFGPHAGYFRHLTEQFGPDYPWHNWSYPPHYLLLIWPLGFFNYDTALVLFVTGTLALYISAVRAFAGELNMLTAIAVAPYVVLNAWAAQNGFLVGALALAALSCRDRHPVVAGILIGLLTIKPQLGILFPVLLLAERRWRTLIVASLTTVLLFVLSCLLFGIDAWRGYVEDVLPYQTLVMRELAGTFLWMMPSVYGLVRFYGASAEPALAVHAAMALPALAAAIWLIWRIRDPMDRSLVVLIATFLITPYALNYDLGFLAAAAAVLANRERQNGAPTTAETCWLAGVMMLPLMMMPLGSFGIQISPVFVVAALIILVRPQWSASRIKLARASSPASGSD